jgi:serine/threonine protein kinase
LKFLAPSTSRTPEASARLVREARAASVLDHPHIGTIYEIGDADGQPFIAMAYYDGETPRGSPGQRAPRDDGCRVRHRGGNKDKIGYFGYS